MLQKEQNAKHSITKRETKKKYCFEILVNIWRNSSKSYSCCRIGVTSTFSKENLLLNFRDEYISKDSVWSMFNSKCNYDHETSRESLQN